MASTTKPKRWRRRREARPGEIVAAALEVFADRGFSAARLDEVAARAGVSKGTLYLYFPNKEELFKAVVRTALVPNIARAERLVADHEGSTAELIAKLIGMIGAAVTRTRVGAIPKLVIAEAGNFPDLARFYVEEVAKRGFGLFAAVLKRGIDRGEIRPVDPRSTVPLLLAPVLLLALWTNSLKPHAAGLLDESKILERHVEFIRRALAAEKT
jgi:AcrR family transcriptional regulator